MTAHIVEIAPDRYRALKRQETPEQVLKSIVEGINTGNLDALTPLYEPEAAFATQPGSLAQGLPGVRSSLAAFIAMQGTLDLGEGPERGSQLKPSPRPSTPARASSQGA